MCYVLMERESRGYSFLGQMRKTEASIHTHAHVHTFAVAQAKAGREAQEEEHCSASRHGAMAQFNQD